MVMMLKLATETVTSDHHSHCCDCEHGRLDPHDDEGMHVIAK